MATKTTKTSKPVLTADQDRKEAMRCARYVREEMAARAGDDDWLRVQLTEILPYLNPVYGEDEYRHGVTGYDASDAIKWIEADSVIPAWLGVQPSEN